MGIITLGSSTISNIFATTNNSAAVSSSVVGLLSSSYSNGSTWPSTTGSAINVVNSPLISGSGGRWQFNGTDDYLLITQSTLNETFNQSSSTIWQPFTFLFYGTIGSLSTRRALFSAGPGGYGNGGDAIMRTDTTPPAGTFHLDLRGTGGASNRFTITGDSGSLINIAVVQDNNASCSVYQNGVLSATSGTIAGGFAPWRGQNGTEGAYIGFNADVDTDNYNGQLGACYLYNRALTATEISQSSLSFFNGTNLVTASLVYLGSTLVYTSSAAPAPATSMSVATLLVAGGGSGGAGGGGGGGGGGVVYSSSLSLPKGIYAVNVGSGGKAVGNNGGAGQSFSGSRGQDSSFISGSIIVSASGGGAGKGYDYPSLAASNNGGSGGGGSINASNNDSYGSGISGQGFDGGATNAATLNSACAGGGGGASMAGAPVTGSYPSGYAGKGGDGRAFTIRDGNSVTYGGGGGGGCYQTSTAAGAGGAGGGTAGSKTSTNPVSASANTGGGGGGSWRSNDGSNNGISGNGGSGIAVIAYLTSSVGSLIVSGGIEATYTSGGLVYKSHTFLSSSNFVIS